MSEFDKWWEENYMSVSADRTEAEDIYNIGMESQQAKVELLEVQLKGAEERAKLTLDHKNKMVDELQGRIDVYELHIKVLKNIHENDFNEESESSYILGNLDGFFECIEADLKGSKDEN